eukprot:7099551-Alexandrium_andersonii.AAC.1
MGNHQFGLKEPAGRQDVPAHHDQGGAGRDAGGRGQAGGRAGGHSGGGGSYQGSRGGGGKCECGSIGAQGCTDRHADRQVLLAAERQPAEGGQQAEGGSRQGP